MKEPYKKGVAIHLASSLARVLPRGRPRSVDRGWAGWDIELRKDTTRTPTRFKCAEGNMNGSASASFCSGRRSRRPQTRLETSCTRTGRPRRHLRLNQAAGRRAKAQATRRLRSLTNIVTAIQAELLS